MKRLVRSLLLVLVLGVVGLTSAFHGVTTTHRFGSGVLTLSGSMPAGLTDPGSP